MKNKLANELAQFKVEGEVKEINMGPTVTTYEFAHLLAESLKNNITI